jgi:hypothetical protein
LDKEIVEIERLMLKSAQGVVSRKELSRKGCARAAGRKEQQQQKEGAHGQLQRTIWDPGGFQQPCWEAPEQELMNFSPLWSMMQEHRKKPMKQVPKQGQLETHQRMF